MNITITTLDGLLSALNKLDHNFIRGLKFSMSDLDDYESLQEKIKDSENSIVIGLDDCLDFLSENGHKVSGIYTVSDDDVNDPTSMATSFILKHFKDNVPVNFPYLIQTEDYVALWKPV